MNHRFLLLAIFLLLLKRDLSAQYYLKTSCGVNASQQYLHIGNKSYDVNGIQYQTHFENDLMYGFSVGRQLKNYLALELKLNYIKGGLTTFQVQGQDGNSKVSQSANSLQSFLNVVYFPLGTKRIISPYVSVGMGFTLFSNMLREEEINYTNGANKTVERITLFKVKPAFRDYSALGVNFRLHKRFTAFTEVTAQFINRRNMQNGKITSYTENGEPAEPLFIECTACDFRSINFEKEVNTKLRRYAPDAGVGVIMGVRFSF